VAGQLGGVFTQAEQGGQVDDDLQLDLAPPGRRKPPVGQRAVGERDQGVNAPGVDPGVAAAATGRGVASTGEGVDSVEEAACVERGHGGDQGGHPVGLWHDDDPPFRLRALVGGERGHRRRRPLAVDGAAHAAAERGRGLRGGVGQHLLLYVLGGRSVERGALVDHHHGVTHRDPPGFQQFAGAGQRVGESAGDVDAVVGGLPRQAERGSDLVTHRVVVDQRLRPSDLAHRRMLARGEPGGLPLPRAQDEQFVFGVAPRGVDRAQHRHRRRAGLDLEQLLQRPLPVVDRRRAERRLKPDREHAATLRDTTDIFGFPNNRKEICG